MILIWCIAKLTQAIETNAGRRGERLGGWARGSEFHVRLKDGESLPAIGTVEAADGGSLIHLRFAIPTGDRFVTSMNLFWMTALVVFGILLLVVQLLTRPVDEVTGTAWALGLGVPFFVLYAGGYLIWSFSDGTPEPLYQRIREVLEADEVGQRA